MDDASMEDKEQRLRALGQVTRTAGMLQRWMDAQRASHAAFARQALELWLEVVWAAGFEEVG